MASCYHSFLAWLFYWEFKMTTKWEVSEPNGRGNGYRISGCKAWLGYGSEEAKENAHLISSAPEMYIELEKCAKLLRGYESHHLQKGDRAKADRNAKQAECCEKVLAKARGEL
jgi:hypothetical protein